MSATVQETCECGTIGAQAEIRQCSHFHYFYGDRRLASVGSVIRELVPTDYSMVDPAVLENALNRGKFVDKYLGMYVRGETFTITDARPIEYDNYLDRVIDWWNRVNIGVIETQRLAYSLDDGICGAMDFRVIDGVMDMKCVSSLQPSYALQLGAYAEYECVDKAFILHVTKNRIQLVPYDAAKCRQQWRNGLAWLRTLKELKA